MKKTTQTIIDYILSNSHKTSTLLSQETGCGASTIRNILRQNNINKHKIFNPDVIEFEHKYDELCSSRKMAKFYGVCHKTILNFCEKINYDCSKFESIPMFIPEEIDEIVDKYHQISASKLATQLNCSTQLISKIWRNNGLIGKINRTYYSNFDYFSVLDTKDKCYFLGFIAADGCVYDRNNNTNQKLLSIIIHSKDEELLNIFKRYIQSNNPILNGNVVSDMGVNTPTSSLVIVSDKLCDDLIKYGIVPRKTWAYTPIGIPDKFMWHFIRGYFDGDGSISFDVHYRLCDCSISLCGNRMTMTFMSKLFTDFGIDNKLCQDNRKYTDDFFNLVINNIRSRTKFIELLYSDCDDLFMYRKKFKSDMFIERCRSK